MTINKYKKFDVWMADLSGVVGSEQGGCKPCAVISNDIGNNFSPCVTVAVMTSQTKTKLPTHVRLDARLNGLDRDSTLLLEQLRTVDKNRLYMKVATIHPSVRKEINNAIKISLDAEEDIVFTERSNSDFCYV